MKKKRISLRLLGLILILAVNCSEKQFDLEDPAGSFGIVEKLYSEGSYQQVIPRLSEFRSKFPYSLHAIEAELLLANSYFELERYPEAIFQYDEFVKLHPTHEKVPFCYYRMGLSYWKDAPSSTFREQDLTKKALGQWDVLVSQHMDHPLTKDVQDFIRLGKRRIFEYEGNIAQFYCQQQKWQACAYRSLRLIEKLADLEYRDLLIRTLEEASHALGMLAEGMNTEQSETSDNLLTRNRSPKDLKKESQTLHLRAEKMRSYQTKS